MSLIVFGTVVIDNIKTDSGDKKGVLGGSAMHFSMSARFFNKVHIASVVGKNFPAKHKKFLQDRDIDTSSILENEGKTFEWDGEYKSDDFNTAITLNTELGVLADYSPSIEDKQKNISNVFLANFDPDLQLEFLSLMKDPQFVGLDSMNLWIEHKQDSLKKLLKKVDFFVANDAEACSLTGEKNIILAAKALRKMGPKFIIVKKGEHGALAMSDEFFFCFPAYPIEKVVDPTGAGDTFAGGVMGYLSKAKTINENAWRRAVVYGSVLASFNVQGFGPAKTSSLNKEDLEERRKEYERFIKP